jgi:UDP:flavonoid glycosyltransferase YjiC (YdhE family)
MLGALAEGKPMVILPMAADQFINGDKVVRTGSGLALAPVARTPDRIRDAIEQALTYPSYAAAARVLQTEIRAMPPAEIVLADLVDRVSDLAA